jgi:hypothetical protein
VEQVDERRALRRQLLAMVARRQRPGAGSILSYLDTQRFVMEWWSSAESALARVRHAVAGAVAANAYAPPRSTQDIDIIVVAEDGAGAATALAAAGWRQVGNLGGGVRGTSWVDAQNHALDVIELAAPWAREAIDVAQANRVHGMPTLTLPYLVQMKLTAGRTGDLFDISRMLGRATDEEITAARAVVVQFGHPEDPEDFDQLVHAGRLERGRDPDARESRNDVSGR